MGFLWKHCPEGHAVSFPDLPDVLVGSTDCPICRARIPIDDDYRRAAFAGLVERLERAEAVLRIGAAGKNVR